MVTVLFNDALRLAAAAIREIDPPQDTPVGVVRDLYGRLRFAIDCSQADFDADVRERLEAAQAQLGLHAAGKDLLFRDSFSFPADFFSHPDWHRTTVPFGVDEDGVTLGEFEIRLLDRQVTGHDWLKPADLASAKAHPHRIVFFGLKGGVGRSTALSMVAWGLARAGKQVLLVDFDLESPGLSGLLLPADRIAEFGVMDWLVEDSVGQGDKVLKGMVSTSPLGETTEKAIKVAAAMGQRESDYLSKLARAYGDIPSQNGPQKLGERLHRMVEALEEQEKPDVVLIDSRAGLHDLAAAAIAGLADTALLFATGGAQTWLGYQQLFVHWQRRPDVARHVRERLALVRALTPKSDRENGVKAFQQKAYALFAETLYDSIPDEASELEGSYFHPIETDESAPHFPILIDWDERFQEFDPNLRPESGGVREAQIDATFGALINWVNERTQVVGS